MANKAIPEIIKRISDVDGRVDQLSEEIANLSSERVALEPADDDIPKVFFGGALPQTKNDAVMSFRYISKTKDISGYCKTKAQGNSSMSYPKKNQTVKLYKDANCTEKLKIDFRGWGKQNKFCFKANWIDITHSRNIVSARLWGDVVKSRSNYEEIPELLRTSANQGAIDGFPVKVYADGVYQGRYTINIPKDAWMANMDDELDNHCILCGESNADNRSLFRATADINGNDWSDEVHDAVPDTIKTRWNAAIDFIVNSSDDEFITGIGEYFDISSLIDYYIFGIVSCGLDAFGKNQLYMTYDGQKWYPTMYDMDSTWGLWWNGASFVSDDYSRDNFQDFKDGEGNLLYIRMESLFADEIKTRYAELRTGALSIENIINRFERFIDIVPPHIVEEDYSNTTEYGSFTGIPSKSTNNIQQIRGYVRARLLWCDNVILANVPSEYTVVAFIQGDGTQYIDTEISGGTNAEYEILFDPSSTTAVNYEQYFGGDKNTAVPKFYHNKGDNQVQVQSTQINSGSSITTVALDNGYNLGRIWKFSYTKDGKFSVWGDVKGEAANPGFGWGNKSWYVFANHEEGLMSSMRLYGLKMWTDGKLVRDFVPVVRNSDGVAGLYDLVDHRFFQSGTTSAFVAFTGEEGEYRPSIALSSAYQEVVIDEITNINIPSFSNNPSGENGSTHFEIIVPSLDIIFPDVFYLSGDIAQKHITGSTVIYNTKTWNGNNYLCISLPTNIVGKTLNEVKNWLSEHKIIFYMKSKEPIYSLEQATTFDGTNYIDTGVQLFAEDKPFTVMIDWTHTVGTNVASYSNTIAHCLYEESPYYGLSVQYANATKGIEINCTQQRSLIKASVQNDGIPLASMQTMRMVIKRRPGGVIVISRMYNNNGRIYSDFDHYHGYVNVTHTLLLGASRDMDGTIGRFGVGIMNDCKVYDYAITDAQTTSYLMENASVENILDNITFSNNYTYNDVGDLIYTNNALCTEKFSLQDGSYLISSISYCPRVHVWDSDDRYIGMIQANYADGLFTIKSEYKYAISVNTDGLFNKSVCVMTRVDNSSTMSDAISIKLSELEFVSNTSKNAIEAVITNELNWGTATQNILEQKLHHSNMVGIIGEWASGVHCGNSHEFTYVITPYNGDFYLGIHKFGTSVDDAMAFFRENNTTLVING